MDGRPSRRSRRRSRCTALPTQPDRPPPKLAEHTDEILAELGFAAGEIAELRDEGAFGKAGSREPARDGIRESLKETT